MGRYYIDRGLYSTDIYILDFKSKSKYEKHRATGIEISDKELKELILKERADGKEVNLWWKEHKGNKRISHFQKYIEDSTYNRVMNNDIDNN